MRKLFLIFTLVLPFFILIRTCWFSKNCYTNQTKILKKITPKSSEDAGKILLNMLLAGFSAWCIIFFIFSFIEQIQNGL